MEQIVMGSLIATCLLAAEIYRMFDQSYRNRNKYNELSHWHLHLYDSNLRPKNKFKLKDLFKIK